MYMYMYDLHSIRSLGSAALNSCMVASGCADSYYEYGVHCWDIAASVVIIQEAGGVCISPSGMGMSKLEINNCV